ncbi:type 1 glutamine amidotransferase domain-containing protein [Legionella taurinensis]|uniref:DJ-1/PfpI/YhbO family deglycase/protease n=1 Tax=Legionella taurinensis TaxID=70611 RepID=A0A3A5L175_9GAMM|nr:type 1 glutamine amidotransferase domain-containing protein [Legionella taurinensis]RJT43954.1 DJ-1/PfpI/YhbO family deglycase/protease [Legionella taurinensis]RJT64977.1 DJ-1/PfpI/YhbO family deglycase/protease [Legionella taurinensis]STY27186.1 intracellular protease, ThiJ/PfpI family [Legionella taurinensis]
MENLNGLKVAILVANGFEQVELVKPRHALEEAGAETFLISPEKDALQGFNHLEKGDRFTVDIPLNEARADEFDALLLPGGVANPDRLRLFPEAVSLVSDMHRQHKPIAAICHGPWLLIDADVVKGHQVTSWPSIKADLINAGAHWVDKAVVCDDLILTSRKPDDIPQFNEAMLKLFHKRQSHQEERS